MWPFKKKDPCYWTVEGLFRTGWKHLCYADSKAQAYDYLEVYRSRMVRQTPFCSVRVDYRQDKPSYREYMLKEGYYQTWVKESIEGMAK